MVKVPNPNFMAGVPELVILRLLQKREMYGYEIVQAIRAETGDVVSVGEGVVYTVLHALERERALKSRRKTVEGRSRIYYTVTAGGLQRYKNLARDWTTLAGAVQTVINGKPNAAA
jgi:PadR family transcriptional regulator PadR